MLIAELVGGPRCGETHQLAPEVPQPFITLQQLPAAYGHMPRTVRYRATERRTRLGYVAYDFDREYDRLENSG